MKIPIWILLKHNIYLPNIQNDMPSKCFYIYLICLQLLFIFLNFFLLGCQWSNL